MLLGDLSPAPSHFGAASRPSSYGGMIFRYSIVDDVRDIDPYYSVLEHP